jgi:mediator of RNA polymerase II transcription subunit 31
MEADPSCTIEKRLYIELEFVQNLANAAYLHNLATKGYLEQDSFIAFLKYLRYWKDPKYIGMLVFPQCLSFLDALIDNRAFRRELSLPQFMNYIHQQQGAHWLHRDI